MIGVVPVWRGGARGGGFAAAMRTQFSGMGVPAGEGTLCHLEAAELSAEIGLLAVRAQGRATATSRRRPAPHL